MQNVWLVYVFSIVSLWQEIGQKWGLDALFHDPVFLGEDVGVEPRPVCGRWRRRHVFLLCANLCSGFIAGKYDCNSDCVATTGCTESKAKSACELEQEPWSFGVGFMNRKLLQRVVLLQVKIWPHCSHIVVILLSYLSSLWRLNSPRRRHWVFVQPFNAIYKKRSLPKRKESNNGMYIHIVRFMTCVSSWDRDGWVCLRAAQKLNCWTQTMCFAAPNM